MDEYACRHVRCSGCFKRILLASRPRLACFAYCARVHITCRGYRRLFAWRALQRFHECALRASAHGFRLRARSMRSRACLSHAEAVAKCSHARACALLRLHGACSPSPLTAACVLRSLRSRVCACDVLKPSTLLQAACLRVLCRGRMSVLSSPLPAASSVRASLAALARAHMMC